MMEEKAEKSGLEGVLDEVTRAIEQGVAGFSPTLKREEVGRVKSVGQGIIWADGLGQVQSEELVTVGPDISGMVLDLLPDRVGIILFGPSEA
ncbi:MAG: F0F1 ATP synthase subunit alpha, partial [Deltaproteobacteria bacterium]|nr:F0F1 ATP synthase subunit alpha [Deltaproteobacteria bacterium]